MVTRCSTTVNKYVKTQTLEITCVTDKHEHTAKRRLAASSCWLPAVGSIRSAAAEGLKSEESLTPFPHVNPEHPAKPRLMWVTQGHTHTHTPSTVTLT